MNNNILPEIPPTPPLPKDEIKTIKVIVGMSGGVDSSVAAHLLIKQGYIVEGLFMKNWEEDDDTEYCTARQDLADAQQVADELGIPLHQANFSAEYWDRVFEYFLAEYRAGRTPNPDILCNKEIKFKAFLTYAQQLLGADKIATGHYAQWNSGHLCKSLDQNKDQSYFLHAVSGAQLSLCLFPLGKLLKSDIRKIAQQQGFGNYAKKDSTGICFIGERRFKDFLQTYLSAQPGPIRSIDGVQLGEHQGLMYHTLGQRQGLGIGGVARQEELPWYVVEKDCANNVLIVAQGHDHPALLSHQLITGSPHWISEAPNLPLKCKAKVRYRQADQACLVNQKDTGLSVIFDEPQWAVTPGQSIVFYQEDICLGGAVIESTKKL